MGTWMGKLCGGDGGGSLEYSLCLTSLAWGHHGVPPGGGGECLEGFLGFTPGPVVTRWAVDDGDRITRLSWPKRQRGTLTLHAKSCKLRSAISVTIFTRVMTENPLTATVCTVHVWFWAYGTGSVGTTRFHKKTLWDLTWKTQTAEMWRFPSERRCLNRAWADLGQSPERGRIFVQLLNLHLNLIERYHWRGWLVKKAEGWVIKASNINK